MKLKFTLLSLGMVLLSACNGANATSPNEAYSNTENGVSVDGIAIHSPSSSGTSAKAPIRKYKTDVLLYTGLGAWAADITSLESILSDQGASYDEVNSDQLNSMTVDELAQYGLIIFPGGQGGTQASSLTEITHANLRAAVQERGVSYFGICAGAFIAVAPAPQDGGDVSYGLGIVNGPILDYYYLENQGTDIAMTMHSFADGTKADILWYGGPMTPNVSGGVIAKYPDGSPAISQMKSGKGFVILSGGHPTATESTLSALGVRSSDGTHLDITWNLINAALHGKPMQAF